MNEPQLKPQPGADAGAHAAAGDRRLLVLAVTALGVVFGDIGTSPLYALRECFHPDHGIAATTANVYGVLSLMFWALILVVTVKYLLYVMRADNRGEGGILALMALARPARAADRARQRIIVYLGLFGAALFYGDGIITPAISVLSAVEGVAVVAPAFEHWVQPITIAVLLSLFMIQRHGTARVGALFGPVILVWFAVLGALGLTGILRHPEVLAAVSPLYGLRFMVDNGGAGFLTLGAVFLVVTGGEALYADMGHFGARPIRLAWFVVAMPALLLNYFGQGALLIDDPGAIRNPFFLLAPEMLRYPLLALATMATVIASQAVISGTFSLTRQAVQLGFSPRVAIHHTSASEIGQIYIPFINWFLMLATVGTVLGFGTSSNLAAAYGTAVTTGMVITALLAFVVARWRWRWPAALAVSVTFIFVVIDLAFWGANIVKVTKGGWFPLATGAAAFALFSTWKTGRELLADRLRRDQLPTELFVAELDKGRLARVPGMAVYLTAQDDGIPRTVLHQIKFNHVLHERVVLLTISSHEVPYVTPGERLQFEELSHGLYRIRAGFGFMEQPDVPRLLVECREKHGLQFEIMQTTFILGRETLIPSKKPGMALWREHLFAFMSQNAYRATQFFRIPTNRVVELGIQVQI